MNRIQYALGENVALCAAGGGGCTEGESVATCPAGMVVTGGGYEYDTARPTDVVVPYNSSSSDGTAWIVEMINNAAAPADFYAVAHCVPGSFTGPPAAAAK